MRRGARDQAGSAGGDPILNRVQTQIEVGRRMGDGADRDHVHAGFGDGADGGQVHPARGLQRHAAALGLLHRRGEVFEAEIVQKDALSASVQRLVELQERGTTVLLASHDEGHIRRLCCRTVWLAQGRIQAEGDPDTVGIVARTTSADMGDAVIAGLVVLSRG
jgi:hypothetical protein